MAAKRTKKFRRSPADIKKAWQKLEPELAKQRKERERQGETFTSITREEFEAKLKRVNSPMIVSQSWNNTAPPGGTINYTVGVMNPDPVAFGALAVAVSIGNRNPIVSNDQFLTTFDARFPTYAKPATIGFSLPEFRVARSREDEHLGVTAAQEIGQDLEAAGASEIEIQQHHVRSLSHGQSKCLIRADGRADDVHARLRAVDQLSEPP